MKMILENHTGSLLGFESRAWTPDIYLSGTVISSSTSILFIQGSKAVSPWVPPDIPQPIKSPCKHHLCVSSQPRQSWCRSQPTSPCCSSRNLPNSVGVEREELRPRRGSDLCGSMVQQGERSTKGQPLSGGVSSLIYVTCKLQPTAFCTMPRVSAENGIAHNCIVCLEGTRDPDQVQQDLCHSSQCCFSSTPLQ